MVFKNLRIPRMLSATNIAGEFAQIAQPRMG
jgi:hypothetical protein